MGYCWRIWRGSSAVISPSCRAESFQKDVDRLLEQYAFEKYSLEECAYSLSYIYNETVLFTDYEQVRQFVRERQAEIQNRE